MTTLSLSPSCIASRIFANSLISAISFALRSVVITLSRSSWSSPFCSLIHWFAVSVSAFVLPDDDCVLLARSFARLAAVFWSARTVINFSMNWFRSRMVFAMARICSGVRLFSVRARMASFKSLFRSVSRS